jgi:hypothetical protein
MVRPASFSYNEQTALSNTFQNKTDADSNHLKKLVLSEFDAFVEKLTSFGILVMVIEDNPEEGNPDAVFPNNWISLHEDGTIVLYPMCTPNRRSERRQDIIEQLKQLYTVEKVIDLSGSESENRFLEGTGSIIFDHVHKIAYACLSPRTDENLFISTCKLLGYQPVYFNAVDAHGTAIYHTNVLMCLAENFVVICLSAVQNEEEKEMIVTSFKKTGKEMIDISFSQMSNFAGNMLALKNEAGNDLLALSQSAYNSLSDGQRNTLEKYCTLIPLAIPTIETIGGGSARCMIAENFLPIKSGL